MTIVRLRQSVPEAMKHTLAQFNVVLAANRFNPSVFRESWLTERGLLRRDDLQPGFVFAENVVSLSTPEFDLLVLPQNLTLVPRSSLAASDVVGRIIPVVVQELPHTPFTGIGLNFVWNTDTEPESVAEVTRKLFANSSSRITESFSAADARFGMYLSKDVEGSRLKLDIKPLHVLDEAGGKLLEIIQFSFNFHRDLGTKDNFAAVTDACARWNEHFRLSEQIIGTIGGVTTK